MDLEYYHNKDIPAWHILRTPVSSAVLLTFIFDDDNNIRISVTDDLEVMLNALKGIGTEPEDAFWKECPAYFHQFMAAWVS